MRKIFAFCLLLLISIATFSQANTSMVSPIKTDYLKKSRNQKTAAIILVCGGGALAITGTAIGLSDLDNIVGPIVTPHKSHEATADALLITGSACILGSIPLFISSSHNKHKAMSMTFNNDFVPGLQKNFIVKKPIEELSLVLRF